MAVVPHLVSPLKQGKEVSVIKEEVTAAGTTERTFTLDADTFLLSVQATVLTGTLTIEALTETAEGQQVSILTYPVISAPTTVLQLKEPDNSQTMQRVRIRATYTGTATYQVRARGLARGQSRVQVQGNGSWDATQTDIGTTATLVIPAALNDRSGLVLLNNNLSSGKLYIGPTAAKAVVATGYPIGPQQAIALDIDAGAEVYAIADSGTIDVRILEAGL